LHPSVIKDGYYTTPTEPGYSVEMKSESMEEFGYSNGKFWTSETARPIREHLKRD
jgi:L-galactonate dehydratase